MTIDSGPPGPARHRCIMKQLTAQDIHAAFVAASEEKGKPPLRSVLSDWECVTERSKRLYAKMAEYLNSLSSQEQEQKV